MPSVLQIKTNFNSTQFILNGVTPSISIDGVVAPRRWGWSAWLLQPGYHEIVVWFPYLGMSSGKARMQILLQEGETKALQYSAPFLVMMAGSLREVQPIANIAQPVPPGTQLNPMAQGPGSYGMPTNVPYSDKSKITAGLLQLFLGCLAIGRFYTGHFGLAFAQIAVTWLTCGFGALWPIIDGIVILTGSPTDADGRPLR